MSYHILIVEDEIKLAKALSLFLEDSGYSCTTITNGLEVIPFIKETKTDMVFLDVMLPNCDGITICNQLRQFSTIPILIMSSKVEDNDRLLGLDVGADDYICKPYSLHEMVARAKRIFRRQEEIKTDNTLTNTIIIYRDIEVDIGAHSCKLRGEKVTLTPTEFRLLKALITHIGHTFSRSQLADLAYEDNRIVSSPTINTHINNLRKKFNTFDGKESYISSIYGIGYRIEAIKN